MKIMRSNYDKKHRCPDWSGPAFKGGTGDCPGGSLSRQMYGHDGGKKYVDWKFYVCYQCGTIVLPPILRHVDPSWIKWRMERRVANWKYEREMNRFEQLD